MFEKFSKLWEIEFVFYEDISMGKCVHLNKIVLMKFISMLSYMVECCYVDEDTSIKAMRT